MKEGLSILPFAENASVDNSKISNYLLCLTHPVGRAKALFFRQVGFDDMDVTLFSEFLKQHAKIGTAVLAEISGFGQKYIVEGPIITPIGKAINLRTIWMIKGEIPYLVTAYPVNK